MYIAHNNDKTLLVDLAFIDYPGWFGGKSRSVQIKELIEEKDYRFEKVELPKPNKWQVILYGIAYFIRFGYFKPFGYRSFVNSAYLYFGYLKIFRQYPDIQIVIKEGTGYGDLVIVNIIKKTGRKVYFVPANIESLCEYYKAWTHKLPIFKRFAHELKYYRKADAVFCISEEEYWLLRLFQCNAFFLPYFPPKTIQEKISKLRNNRNPTAQFGYITYGDFTNLPHKQGLISFINDIKNNKIQLKYPLKIAGFGTDSLKDEISSIPNVELIGTLSDIDLENALQKCKGVFIFHKPTGGMITRIPELIESNIPIIGNIDALKCYVFHDLTQLEEDNATTNVSTATDIWLNKKNYFYKQFQEWI